MTNGSEFPEFDVDPNVKRQDFPVDFKFGVGSSAYQIEGAYHSDGKGLHIWDCHAQRNPDKILDGSNACVTVDGYHRIKEDVQLLKKMGVNYYRFSISWSRVLPGGKVCMGKNQEGIDYYNNLINELLANHIEPFVTLYHWDLPVALEEEYMGFLSTKIIDDFANYVELCFWEFGDRVKHWTTFNEPYRFIFGGYVDGGSAPGRGGKNKDGVIENGDPETEPYIVAVNLLNAHAKAYHLYQDNFKMAENGRCVPKVWNHFAFVVNDTEKKKVECIYCKKICNSSIGGVTITTSLQRHLKSCLKFRKKMKSEEDEE